MITVARKYAGVPGLAVSELFSSDLGSKDLQQGLAKVFVKSGAADEHPIVLHEYLAARLAHSLGVPVPFGELAAVQNGERAWATAIVGSEGEISAPPNPTEVSVAEPHIYAGIAVFDVWLLNIDRSEANLIWTPDGGLWAIDHEQCFEGHDPRGSVDLANRHHLVHRSSVYREAAPSASLMDPWISLIRTHGGGWARTAGAAAYQRNLASKSTLATYEKFLRSRASNLAFLVQQTYDSPQENLFQVDIPN